MAKHVDFLWLAEAQHEVSGVLAELCLHDAVDGRFTATANHLKSLCFINHVIMLYFEAMLQPHEVIVNHYVSRPLQRLRMGALMVVHLLDIQFIHYLVLEGKLPLIEVFRQPHLLHKARLQVLLRVKVDPKLILKLL